MAKQNKKKIIKKAKKPVQLRSKVKPANKKKRKILVVKKKENKEKKERIRKVIVKAKIKKQFSGPVRDTKKNIPVKKTAVRRTVKKTEDKDGEKFAAESLFKAKIKVVGIGGGGGSIVSEIGKTLQKATFVVADTDVRALKKKPGIKYFCFGNELTHGLGTGVNVDLAKRAAESAKEKISGIFKDQDIVIFIASLGGGLGSGATQVFADVAKEFGGITLGIFTMPFKFEGANKYRIAQNALKSLRQSLNVSLVIPNEKIFKVIDANTAITDAFSMVNKSLIESLESLIDLIYSPGIINIDFADLRAILSGIGNSAFLNTIEESGKDRADKICERILINPLLQNNNFEVEKILLNISGAANLSMLEVEKISRKVSELNPKAKIIFGISKNQKLKNKIKTTILMTGGGGVAEVEKAEPEPVKVVEKIKETIKEEVKPEKKVEKKIKEPVTFIPVPVFPAVAPSVSVIEERKINVIETVSEPARTSVRRSGLEIRKAEELEEKRRQQQEKEWEIPAFLRKVKYNK